MQNEAEVDAYYKEITKTAGGIHPTQGTSDQLCPGSVKKVDIYGKGEDETTLSSRFLGVIRRASEQAGRGVVVLVDEYDKPLLQAIQNVQLLDSYRSTLKAFYGVLKSADRYLRFAFLTGVTKFSQVSVFSDLNQLNDISLNYDFSTLCGITREELLANFEPEIAALSKRMI